LPSIAIGSPADVGFNFTMRPSGEPSFPYAAGILFGLGLPPTSTLSQALPSCGGAHGPHLWWSTRLLIGTMLIGFGAFNVVQGLVDHHSLGLHHV